MRAKQGIAYDDEEEEFAPCGVYLHDSNIPYARMDERPEREEAEKGRQGALAKRWYHSMRTSSFR